ncbi:sulfurtransferase TusA family protein [Candidatus Magnetominusculus dajiuhuensis]|uniref:sulfurtransferase TusA family protein n=1 Tax=Candidatus Magnetominusculus dajiuhuensis TaxID=3137712 RepID=UPI003B43938A
MVELRSQEPTEVLDVLGRVCPYPLVLTKKKLQKMDSGTLLKVLCDAPASAEDSIPKYAQKEGFGFDSVKMEDKGHWELYIKKS